MITSSVCVCVCVFLNVYSTSRAEVIKQLKEMVLAILHESDLLLSDDVVETIVDKVQFGSSVSNSIVSFLFG